MDKFFTALLFFVFGFLLFLTSCKNESTPFQMPPVEVTTVKVEAKTIPVTFSYVGFTESSHLVEIRARVEGYLNEIAYNEGEMVKKDALLFVLDPKPYEASLDKAKATLEKQQAILWNANQTLDRLKPLYEKNAVSKRDLDNATAEKLTAEAEVNAAKSQVVEAELNLSYTKILAPVAGLAGRSNFREGALISPGPNGLLTTISVFDPMWVNFSVPEGDILKYTNELKNKTLEFPPDNNFTVEITLSDGTTFPSKGKIDFADPTLSQSTGAMMVRAVFDNKDNLLRPGQFIRANVSGASRPNAIAVPQKAVMQGNSGMFVYVVEEGKAISKPIKAGDWVGTDWIIESGLKDGDQVIVDGINKIGNGSTVTTKAL